MNTNVFVQLGVSLLLGLLVGLQRERSEPAIAGIRTFPLITLLGTVSALLGVQFGGWMLAAGLLALAALFVIGNLARLQAGDIDPGLTTEAAALLMFGVGAYLVIGSMGVAVAVGGAVAVLLQVIMISSAIVYVRVLIEIAAVASSHFAQLSPPLFAMLILCAVIAIAAYLALHKSKAEFESLENPAELRSALVFGALYAVVILAVAAAREYFGSGGLYAVAVLSGLTDMDAITLSTSQLVTDGRLGVDTGWRLILVASLANFFFKAGIVATMGHRALLGIISLVFGLAVTAGAAILLFWPTYG